MTSQSPRIYLYKITFEEVPYYYYGVHKEKKYNEYYMGSPCRNKWFWEFYTPKKQILEIFDFTDEGWVEAQEVEKRLIKSFYNDDKWCLNECCGGIFSLNILRQNGIKTAKKYSKRNYELGKGIHGLSKEQIIQNAKTGVETQKRLGLGIYGLTAEERSENSKKYSHLGVETQKRLGIGLYGITTEERKENGKKSAKTNEKNKTGLYSFTTEDRKEYVKITNSQRWECCETGYISTAAGVVSYQRGKGIDTSKNNRRQIL